MLTKKRSFFLSFNFKISFISIQSDNFLITYILPKIFAFVFIFSSSANEFNRLSQPKI